MKIKAITYSIVGAGRVASSLNEALIKAGFKTEYIISRNINSAKQLDKNHSLSSDSLQLAEGSNFIFITVPDDEIKQIDEAFSRLKNFNFKNKIFVHFSGALTISELDKVHNLGAGVASLHIMQTFPDKKAKNLKNLPAAIETEDERVRKELFELANRLQLKPFDIKSEHKTFYHLMGVFSANFLISNMYSSILLGEKVGLSEEDTIRILEPILKTTFNNIKKMKVKEALTGPVKRGDKKTIQEHELHLEQLSDLKELKEKYKIDTKILKKLMS